MAKYIDIHHHVAYGMDDGARDLRRAQKMLDAAYDSGIRIIFATPHVHPGKKYFDYEKYCAQVDELNSYCEECGYDLQVLPGAEILHTDAAVRLLNEGAVPTLNNTRFVLVEWRTSVSYPVFEQNIRELYGAGYIPVIAHIERYRNLWLRGRDIEQLRNAYDIRVQIDCEAMTERIPFFEKLFIRRLMKAHVVDYLATDAHNTSDRKANMADAYRAVKKSYGKRYAKQLTYGNQRELFGDD